MKICIIGSTGYAGQQLASLLHRHPQVRKLYLGSYGSAHSSFEDKYRHALQCVSLPLLEVEPLISSDFILSEAIDMVFLALPHGKSATVIHELLPTGVNIIDLGADYRIKDPDIYAQWYGEHPHPIDLPKSVYGLSEVYKEGIQSSQLIANPGCYATATLLAALPAVSLGILGAATLFVDGKSGISGAGRQTSVPSLYAEAAENLRPYHTGTHRHTPEIEQQLSIHTATGFKPQVLFSPTVVPMTRGMICSVYGKLEKDISLNAIKAYYKEFYGDAHFIRWVDTPPESKAVRGSNYADIWLHVDERTQSFVAMTAIDNLMKGAASQAVQNMNLRMGFKETAGIDMLPLYP